MALRILIIDAWLQSTVRFRETLVRALIANGHAVTVTAGVDEEIYPQTMRSWGAEVEAASLQRASMNPLADIGFFFSLLRLMKRKKFDLVLSCTLKPATYGTMAAFVAGIPRRYALLTGLGYAFIEGPSLKRSIARRVAWLLARIALPRVDRVIFQNPDDQATFRSLGLLKSQEHSICVDGSGVDLARFAQVPLPTGPISFLLIARLLKDKGVYEFIEAAALLKARYPSVRFCMVGPTDPNPASLQPSQIDEWVKKGTIEYLGVVSDVRASLAACHVFVLPSYREGTPRAVLEAMAVGRAIVTTDAPGCRQTVIGGANGILVPVRDGRKLADAMEHFILHPEDIAKMGQASRHIAEQVFDANKVAAAMMAIMHLTGGGQGQSGKPAAASPLARG